MALISTGAKLARAKDEIMKTTSPAPASPSLIHAMTIFLFVAFCSSYVPANTQEQKVINFLLAIN
jgi:hypothetical protein